MFEADSETSSDDGDTCQSSCRIINESLKGLENHDYLYVNNLAASPKQPATNKFGIDTLCKQFVSDAKSSPNIHLDDAYLDLSKTALQEDLEQWLSLVKGANAKPTKAWTHYKIRQIKNKIEKNVTLWLGIDKSKEYMKRWNECILLEME